MNNYEEIKKIIEDFLEKLTVDFNEIEIIENEIHPTIHIKTDDSGVLIGNNGESLKALNHIIKKIAEKKLNQKEGNLPAHVWQAGERLQFLLDVNDYHRKKMDALKNQAKILAERARMFKSDVEMNPMNAYERMIIHATFANDNEIDTKSEGEGKTRRVILKYKSR